jgi:AraC family transcriptional regulator
VRSVIAAGRVAGDVFNGHDTHRLASMPTHRLIASSEGLGWRNMYAAVQREAPFDSYLDAVDDHLFVFHLTGSAGIHWSMSERTVDGRVTPGCYDYFPGGRGVGVQLRGSIETMHLYLRSRVVDAAIAEMQVGGERVTLEPVFNGRDPFIIQMAIALRSALNERSTANQIYAENLSWALAAHLVRSSNHAHSTDSPAGGLSEDQLRRVIAYIDANIDSALDVDKLSSAACLHPVYFGRQFKRATNTSPHQFVIERRVERAKRLLESTRQPIAEVAAACGFCHQEHLTRVFRARCGTTPSAYRKLSSRRN